LRAVERGASLTDPPGKYNPTNIAARTCLSLLSVTPTAMIFMYTKIGFLSRLVVMK